MTGNKRPYGDAIEELLQQALSRTHARPTTSRRLKSRVYDDDVHRIQAKLELVPSGFVRDPETMRGPEVAGTLRRIGASIDGVNELHALREMLSKRLADCTICQCALEAGERVVFLACGHTFHHTCIHKEAQAAYERKMEADLKGDDLRPTCPMCRALVE